MSHSPNSLTVLFRVAAVLAAAILSAAGARAAEPRDWDRELPGLQLHDVDLTAESLEAAWKELSTRHLVRSLLYVEAPARTAGAFRFKCSECSARRALDALVAAYPDFEWSADPGTGVLWIHPKAADKDFLPERLRLSRGYCAVPLQTGFVQPLATAPGANVVPTRWGTTFTNTLDVAVDVPAGDHRLRDLLGLVVKAHPTKAFYVHALPGGRRLTAVHLGSDRLTHPPEGALLWWRLHFGAFQGKAPTPRELVGHLAASSPQEREAAREYLEAVDWQVDLDALVRTVPRSAVEAAWAAVGVASVVVRSPQATHRASAAASERLLASRTRPANRPLELLAALERDRLSGRERPRTKLAAPADPTPVLRDLVRLAYLYEPAREIVEAVRSRGLKSATKAAGSDPCRESLASPWQATLVFERPNP